MADIRPDTQNRVQLRPVTDAKLEAQDFGQEKIGRGLAGFGQNLTQVAQDWDDINAIHNEAAVKETDNGALAEELALIREIESLKGKDALLANERYAERMDGIRKAALSKLTNDRQKRMFTDVFDRRAISNNDRVSRFVTKATFDYNIAATEGQIDTHIARAADVYDEADPSEFDASVLTIVNATKQRGALKGNDDDMTKADTEKFVGSAYAAVVERIAVEDPIRARKFLDDHAGKLPADLETKLRQRLQPEYEEMRAEQIADEVISGAAAAGIDSRVVNPSDAPEMQPDPAKAEKNAAFNADPLRGKGGVTVKGGEFGAARDGGKRVHGGLDRAAPEGTPVYPRMGARVIEIDKVGKTDAGFYVKMINDDGTYVSYSHLRNVNVEPGQRIDIDTVVGGVGRTGKGGKPAYGAHLHEVIRVGGENGKAIDARTYKPGKAVEGAAVAGYAPKYEGNTVDIKAAYAGIEKKYREGEISLSLRKRAMQAVDDRARREDAVKDREYAAADKIATEAMVEIIKSGGDLTDPIRQIPNFGDLSAPSQLKYLSAAEEVKARQAAAAAAAAEAANKARIEGNYSAFLDLQIMADQNPAKFMQVPLDSLRGSFPESDWKSLKKTQEEYRRQGTYRPQLAPERSMISGLVDVVLGDAGINPKQLKDPTSKSAKRKAYLVAEATRQVDAYQQSGKKMSQAQIYEEVLKPLLLRVAVSSPGFFGDSEEEMPWYQAQMEGYTSARIVD